MDKLGKCQAKDVSGRRRWQIKIHVQIANRNTTTQVSGVAVRVTKPAASTKETNKIEGTMVAVWLAQGPKEEPFHGLLLEDQQAATRH